MPGKPRRRGFPEKAFTVEDGKGLDSERESVKSAAISTVNFMPADDSHR